MEKNETENSSLQSGVTFCMFGMQFGKVDFYKISSNYMYSQRVRRILLKGHQSDIVQQRYYIMGLGHR